VDELVDELARTVTVVLMVSVLVIGMQVPVAGVWKPVLET